jgi:hypothetical protein
VLHSPGKSAAIKGGTALPWRLKIAKAIFQPETVSLVGRLRDRTGGSSFRSTAAKAFYGATKRFRSATALRFAGLLFGFGLVDIGVVRLRGLNPSVVASLHASRLLVVVVDIAAHICDEALGILFASDFRQRARERAVWRESSDNQTDSKDCAHFHYSTPLLPLIGPDYQSFCARRLFIRLSLTRTNFDRGV